MPACLVLTAHDEDRARWCDQLRARGWTVYDAADIQSAIDVAVRHHPVVVVTAVALPNLTGLHFVRTLRGVVEHDVKIVGVADATQRSPELRAGGFDLIVSEPIDFASLQRTIAITDDDGDERKATTKIPAFKPRDR